MRGSEWSCECRLLVFSLVSRFLERQGMRVRQQAQVSSDDCRARRTRKSVSAQGEGVIRED